MRTLLVPLFCSVLSLTAFAQEGKTVDVKALRAAGQAAVQAEDWNTAIAKFEALTKLEPKQGGNWHMLGYSLHAAKRYDEALKIHEKAAEFANVKPVATYNIACVHALKGDKDKAFEYLGKAIDAGFSQPEQLSGDTDMDSLRDDPRWKDIVAKIEKAAANREAGPAQPFVITTARKSARVAYFDARGGSPGQLAIDYAAVPWQDKYDQVVESPKMVGKHWRFGSDFWTSLDTNLPISIGGVAIQPGYYYLTLMSKGDGKFSLFLHDAAEVRKTHLDAFKAEKLTGGVEVPLAHSKSEKKAETLAIAITVQPTQPTGEFTVNFGNHELTAKVEIAVK
jgi:tetratricopeptide (TPR) repeat protein